MDAFSYLSVLLSIILGLAITQVLQGYRALLLNRHRVRLFFPPLGWSVFILLAATQSWWSSFGLADHKDWSFLTFSVILLQTVLLYMTAALVLPDIPPEQELDLRAHYYREVTPFFAVWLALLLTSLTKGVLLDNRLPATEDLLFHGSFAGLAVVALTVRREWVHQVLAGLNAALLLAYIALLFARL